MNSISFSPDGRVIASASHDSTIKLWSLDGTLLQTLEGHSSIVWGVSFSPDGKMLASGSDDNTVILWNMDLDDLLIRACHQWQDYLKTNANIKENDRYLCHSIKGF